MAWMNKKGPGSFGSQGGLEKAFGKQTQNVGRMNGPAMALHPATMKPSSLIPKAADFGSGMGLPPLSKSGQSPAQHAAVEKAAQASASKRRKFV